MPESGNKPARIHRMKRMFDSDTAVCSCGFTHPVQNGEMRVSHGVNEDGRTVPLQEDEKGRLYLGAPVPYSY